MRWIALVALVACHDHEKSPSARELEAARRTEVVELAAADVNRDGTPDVIVGYAPTSKDPLATRFSLVEAFDGRTRATLWTSHLPRWFDLNADAEQSVATDRDHVVFTYTAAAATPNGDGLAAVSVHDLATGRPLWNHTFAETQFWVGVWFRVWLDHGRLLVMANSKSSIDQVVHAFDVATGTELWQHAIGRSSSAPVVVGDSDVLLAERRAGQDIERVAWFFDARTGAATDVKLPSEDVVLGEDAWWIDCPAYVAMCRGATNKDSVATLDLRTRELTKTTHSIAMPMSRRFAVYKDLIIEIGHQHLAATRLGDSKPLWVFDGTVVADEVVAKTQHTSASGAYLADIRARYLPAFVTDGQRERIVILDLETGTPTWTSEPVPPQDTKGFVLYGTHYYANIPSAGAMVGIDGASGKMDAAFMIDVRGHREWPSANYFHQPKPSAFQAGQLLGSDGGSWWMIDLASGASTASPGVEIATPWNDLGRVLGHLPR